MGAKAPPLLQEWQKATPEELQEALKRHPLCNYGLRPDQYLALDPDDQKAADFLNRLEQQGHLPPTVTWLTWQGMSIRLYRHFEGLQPFKINSYMKLEVRTGPGQYCIIPDSTVNKKTYKWFPGKSPADLDVAELPPETLQMLRDLASGNGERPEIERAPYDPGEQIRIMMQRCRFLQHCDQDRATLSEPEWFAMITQFCRLVGGAKWIHHLSQGYPGYSREETDKKILHAIQDSPGPHTCAYIKTIYDCGRNCEVRAPEALRSLETPSHQFNLLSAHDLISQPQEETQWVVEGILPQAGLSLLTSKPKVGKSTMALYLAVSVSRGENFLGRPTIQAPTIYLALEEKAAEIQKRLAVLGVKDEPLYLHIGLAPRDGIDQIDNLIAETGTGLLIVDTLQKLARVRDMNDYALVTNTLEPFLGVARERNCHILLTHHAGKADRRDGDEVLGSTALVAAVDTVILLKKRDHARTLYTIQRYGEDIPETIVQLSPDYSLTIGETLEEARQREAWEKIRVVIENHPEITEAEIIEQTECRHAIASEALRWALRQSPPLVQRQGEGKKGDPYRYFLPPLPPTYTREGEN